MAKKLEELAKAYEPGLYEDDIYKIWEESGFFNPDNLKESKEYFSIAMPPPNATGVLHLGHASALAYEDLMVRYNRLKGKKVLWLPGTDHAAIATQTKVEKILAKEGADRQTLGREVFLQRVKDYVANSQGTIRHQTRKMGSSCDWSRERYTYDDGLSYAVSEAFIRMYEDSLIYRGHRIVNWCPRCASTLADDEVEYKEQMAKLYYIKYGPFIVATTRPETKLADTGVAVHPDDKRYKEYTGQTLEVDLAGHKIKVKVFADLTVDKDFGSGVIGVTPAHSAIDYDFAKSHSLEIIKLIDEQGKILESGGKYKGLTVLAARQAFVKDLEKAGQIDKIEDFKNNLSICYRCDTPIEPLTSEQWFVAVDKKIPGRGKSLKELATEAVSSGEIKILPERFSKIYFHWMENLHDWCISRQIWWGHRIPVWYDEEGDIIVAHNEAEAKVKAKGKKIIQDEATLDTWFSSSLWTFSTLGWPLDKKLSFDKDLIAIIKSGEKKKTYRLSDKGFSKGETVILENSQSKENFGYARIIDVKIIKFKDLDLKQAGHEKYNNTDDFKDVFKKYYPDKDITDDTDLWCYEFIYSQKADLDLFHPTSVLETGYDIIFFWVARMILMSQYILKDKPFDTVYLHGLIRDKEGQKMSKSLGNGIDPLEMIEKFGTDALRLSLIIGSSPGADLRIYEEKIAGYRNFVNKLWNISRFIFNFVEDIRPVVKQPPVKTLADRWILAELNKLIGQVSDDMDNFRISAAGEKIYDFSWNKLADWYLEISKIEKEKDDILLYILEKLLILSHPFTPFVTEKIWQEFGQAELLMIKKWPETVKFDDNIISDFAELQELVVAIRNLKAENKIAPTDFPDCYIESKILDDDYLILASQMARVTLSDHRLDVEAKYINSSIVYIDLSKEMTDKERKDLQKYIGGMEAKLQNESFVKNAPVDVIEETKKRLQEAKNKLK
ncbi:class I tRNA ligase family protein [Patescibacteria group bacterium]|nr:class I tRNA ligase family protein [Patescibacteria group bacterium]